VKLRLHVKKTDMDISLSKGGSMGVESFGQWFPGMRLNKPAPPEDVLTMIVIRGRAEVEAKGKKHVLTGPSVLGWSGREEPHGSEAMTKLPAWLDPAADDSAKATAWHRAVEALRRGLAEKKSVAAALAHASGDKQPLTRAVALLSYSALGGADKVAAGLSDAASTEVRRAAIFALQHQLGRRADGDQHVQTLIAKQFPARQAAIIVRLLRGFSAGDQTRPETWQTLVNYLQHENLAVRELAVWTLSGLVPKAKNIPYDAAAGADDRRRGQEEWLRLIRQMKKLQ
jgi:hypothetical protein